MTIRLRLTLVYSFILAMTLSVFGVALYNIQAQGTLNLLEKDLIISSERIVEALLKTNIAMHLPDQPQISPIRPRAFNDFSTEGTFQGLQEREIVRVLNSQGQLIASPFGREEDALPLSENSLTSLQQNQDIFETSVVAEENMLIYNRPIFINGDIIYIIQVARLLTERDNMLNSLATTLIVAGIVTTLVAFGIGWFFSGFALAPIERMTQTAHAIGEARDFTRRVTHTGQQDEIGRLANTFNQMLASLENAYKKVENSLEQQRNFVFDVSHELRTPLTTLRGNLGLLRRKPPSPPEEQEDILKDMVEESDRLIRLVNELLLLAHADARHAVRSEPLLIQPVLEEVARQAALLDERRIIHLDIIHPASIIGDRDALKQIVLILVDNAIKYSDEDIHIQVLKSGDDVEIRVHDQGKGITPDELTHVFDRFYRTEESAVIPGFGLGLPIAKSLVEAMDGKLTIESEAGHGSSVIVSFEVAVNE
jgi:signal transduction histidine kinase